MSFNHFDERGRAVVGGGGARKTSELIPLSHPLALHSASVDFEVEEDPGTILVKSTVKAFDRTGVEMEAMVSASIAALTIYDMCKGVDRGIRIGDICLLYKEGGRSGGDRGGGSRGRRGGLSGGGARP